MDSRVVGPQQIVEIRLLGEFAVTIDGRAVPAEATDGDDAGAASAEGAPPAEQH